MKTISFTLEEIKKNEFKGDIYAENKKVGKYTSLKFYDSIASLYKVWIEKEEDRNKGTFSNFFKQIIKMCKEKKVNTIILESILDDYYENGKIVKTQNIKNIRNYLSKLQQNCEIESFRFKGKEYLPLYCFIKI
jgi:hypothetical protein